MSAKKLLTLLLAALLVLSLAACGKTGQVDDMTTVRRASPRTPRRRPLCTRL